MGMSASQARLLSLTARMSDTEFQSQQLCNSKTLLAGNADKVSQEYTDALNKTHLKLQQWDDGSNSAVNVDLTYNNLMNSNMGSYRLMSSDGKMVMSAKMQEAINNVNTKSAAILEALDASKSAYEKELKSSGLTDNKLSSTLVAIRLQKETPEYKDITAPQLLANALMTAALLGTVFALIGGDNEAVEQYATLASGGTDSGEVNANNTQLYSNITAEDIEQYVSDYINMNDESKNFASGTVTNYDSSVNYDNLIGLRNAYSLAQSDYNEWNSVPNNEQVMTEFKELTGEDGEVYSNWINSGNSFEFVDEQVANNPDWLKAQLENGNYYIEQYNSDKKTWSATSVATSTALKEEGATSLEMAKAEAKYNQEMGKINAKDKQIDLNLKQLDTEHNAMKTEYESVKKVIDENIQRSFKTFS